MFCAVDIGNTNIVVAFHDGKKWVMHFRVYTDQKKTGDEYFVVLESLCNHYGVHNEDVDSAALSSVVPSLTRSFEKNLYRLFEVRPLVVSRQVPTGLKNETIPPELGSDLICNASGAHFHCPEKPVSVIDFGTALTITTVGADGTVYGCAIAPGLLTAMNSLFNNTAQLPQVELKVPEHAIGRDSMESIRSGIMFGYAGLVDSLIGRTEKQVGSRIHVIATGGLSRTIAPIIPRIDELIPDHTLNGLKHIADLNR